MVQLRHGPDLGQEPLGAKRRGQLGMQDLDGDLPVVPKVVGKVDGGHASLAQLALDPVVAVDQLRGRRGHFAEQRGESLRRRVVQECIGPVVVEEEVFQLRPEPGVGAASVVQQGGPLLSRKVGRRVDQRLERLPALGSEW